MTDQQDERRRFQRSAMLLPAESGPLDWPEDKPPLKSLVVDISSSGLKLRIDQEPLFKVGDRIFIRVERLDSESRINLQGEVRWMSLAQGQADQWELGVKLTGMALEEWDPWLDLLSWRTDAELPPP